MIILKNGLKRIAMSKFDVSVVISTIARKNLLRAVRSIFCQNYSGRIQILIGVDFDIGGANSLCKQLMEECPNNISITWLDLGYSTSIRHGGVHTSYYGGSLRTALSFLANSEYILYLDDDDWLLEGHIKSMMNIIDDNCWAFSYSYYADGDTSTPLHIDEIESVGVNVGVYQKNFGGFVRPSGLLLNKMKTMHLLHLWSIALTEDGDGEDRNIFNYLKSMAHACSKRATVCVSIDPQDGNHALRSNFLKSKGVHYSSSSKADSSRMGKL